MPPPIESQLPQALAGESSAVRDVVAALTPVIQMRASRALGRRGGAHGRDARQELADLTQDVLLLLFRDDARILRAWEPARGLSFLNYVGLVAEREVGHIARSGRRSPWALDPAEDSELEAAGSRDLFDRLHERLERELHPRAMDLYRMLVIDDAPIPEVIARSGLSADAVYAWRSRLLKRARQLLLELQAPCLSESTPARTNPERSHP